MVSSSAWIWRVSGGCVIDRRSAARRKLSSSATATKYLSCQSSNRGFIGFPYGEIYARDGLDLRQRQLATVAALASMGGLEPQLRFHLAGALNVGCSPAELVELMTHLVVYAGFPVALNGTAALRDVLTQ